MTARNPAPNDPRIQRLLSDLHLVSAERHDLLQQVRTLALGLGPGIREELKYGGILFGADAHFCGLFAYREHVSLEFSAGAALPDVHRVLEGAGKLRRHIKLRTAEDVAAKQVRHYLELAQRASLAG
ncbi:DUF1801 domain-containing protein [Inhella proteolytica]|uniref:DUF1801 domain-containing protein n=1 Tax=Inhella proteolytica TaxID=2795029 RepID=A0A931J3Y9_9BURK|nr:DUF1801 domain-containing protein [Inhella proteolytica]MBH9579174.1 DUF1801 domain-containing protein [Inhella proteolytica]